MKIILFILLFIIHLTSPLYSHGSKEDCSTECNDYYCPSEIKKDKDKKSSGNK